MRLAEIEWKPVSHVQVICWTAFYCLLLLYLALNWGYLTMLDNIHLPIHEGGHLLFGWWEKQSGSGGYAAATDCSSGSGRELCCSSRAARDGFLRLCFLSQPDRRCHLHGGRLAA